MKNKIQKFSKGDFRQPKPEVVFEETNLVLIIGEGEVYRGSLGIKSNNESTVRGLVYPSSFRVHFKKPGFEGRQVRLEFTYDGTGLPPGHVEKGKFTVVCTGGEYELAFTAIIERPYVMTTYGKVQSTDDFRKLAIKDFSEAGRLFRSTDFYEILKYENERIFYLYDNMRKWSLGEQALEEFLVGIKQKECIFLTLPGEGMLYEDIHEPTKGVISLMKNTWGYMPIRIVTEGDFLKVTRTEITTEDFVGNGYEVEYLIRPEFLHGGRNFGAVRFVTPYETLTYEVEVMENQEYDEDHHLPELLFAQMLKEYIGYVAGRVEKNTWVENAIERATRLRQIDPQNEFYQLLLAHIYLTGGKKEEAKWILENYNYNRFAIGKNPMTNGYYLYLTALIRGVESYTDRVLDEIGNIDRVLRLCSVDRLIFLNGKETRRGNVFRFGRRFILDLAAFFVHESDFAEPCSAESSGKFFAHGVKNAVTRHAIALQFPNIDKKPAARTVNDDGDILGIDECRNTGKTRLENIRDGAPYARFIGNRLHYFYFRNKPRRNLLCRNSAGVRDVLRSISYVRDEIKCHRLTVDFDLSEHGAHQTRASSDLFQRFLTSHRSTHSDAQRTRARHPPQRCARSRVLSA